LSQRVARPQQGVLRVQPPPAPPSPSIWKLVPPASTRRTAPAQVGHSVKAGAVMAWRTSKSPHFSHS
jgi:hypothetical protein